MKEEEEEQTSNAYINKVYQLIFYSISITCLRMANSFLKNSEGLMLGSSISSDGRPAPSRSLDDFSFEVQELFERQTRIDALLSVSRKLQHQFKDSLQSSAQCMLPSHLYKLPSGKETGVYLALSVGGSNLEVALLELRGQDVSGERVRVRRMESWPIEAGLKDLDGAAFFDWMAHKIKVVHDQDGSARHHVPSTEPLRLGIAWSFPLE